MSDSILTRYAIGFDIGGSKIEAAIVSNRGEIIRQKRVSAPHDFTSMKKCILDLVAEMCGTEEIEGIGFGIPGSIDPATQKLRNAPNSPAIDGTTFFHELEREIGFAMRCENDANCLVLSEHRFGAAKGFTNAVGIILGSGVGGGVVLDKKLLHSPRGLAPEIGHGVILDVNGRECLCGNRGCAEAYLSGNSVLRRFYDAGGAVEVTKTEQVFARTEDAIAVKIVEETLYYFDRFVAALVSLYDPDIIVLGGGLSLQKAFYHRKDSIAGYVFGNNVAPLICQAQNGDASGKLGAAALFF